MPLLIVTLPPPPVPAGGEFGWVMWSSDGRKYRSRGSALPSLLPTSDEVTLALPAAALSWHQVTLPQGSLSGATRLRAVLNGLLEDRLLDEPDSLHFALEPDAAVGKPVWVAACNRAWVRGAVQSLGGICANDPQEAVYINASVDVDGEPLSGDATYRILIGAGEFPPCDQSRHGFWSITLYNSDYNLVPESRNYSINGYYPDYQKRLPDGAMVIWVCPTRPATMPDGEYWLQSPAGDSFYLILRVYVPEPSVSETQSWRPPAIVQRP